MAKTIAELLWYVYRHIYIDIFEKKYAIFEAPKVIGLPKKNWALIQHKDDILPVKEIPLCR